MSDLPRYETYKRVFQGTEMPFAFVDLDLLDANITKILDRAQNKPVRLASKSIRCVTVMKYIFEQSEQLIGIMCFSPREAVFLSQRGFDDLLVGYPAWQPQAIRDVCKEIQSGKLITLMVDSVEQVEHIAAIANPMNVVVPVCIDVDMSVDFGLLHFGVWRSPITTPAQALQVMKSIRAYSSLELTGVMGYEAQIAGLGDSTPGQYLKNHVIRWLKRRSRAVVAQRRNAVVEALNHNGARLRFVNGGGTGSVESTREEPCVTEITVGSGFYSPTLFDYYDNFKHLPAAGFAIEVVRSPKPGVYTCHGGGYVASGAVGHDKQPTPYLPEGASLSGNEGAGEVQTPVAYSGAESIELGDPIFMRHSKAGELCERFTELLLIRNGQVVEKARTYRGDGHAFL